MHVLLVAADLGPTGLFDLVMAREVSSVLDLRAGGRAVAEIGSEWPRQGLVGYPQVNQLINPS